MGWNKMGTAMGDCNTVVVLLLGAGDRDIKSSSGLERGVGRVGGAKRETATSRVPLS